MRLPSEYQTLSRLTGPATAMLVASILVGLIYNAASPLGIRSNISTGSTAPLPDSEAILGNETISMSLVSLNTAPAPGKVYQNETISVSLNWPQTSGSASRPVPSPSPARSSIPSLTWREVKSLLAARQIVLVDARVAAQYQAGHIADAVSLPAHTSPGEISGFAQRYSKTTPLVIYCGTEKCPMSHDLAEVLIRDYGYTNVKVMPGGYAEYRLTEAHAANTGVVK